MRGTLSWPRVLRSGPSDLAINRFLFWGLVAFALAVLLYLARMPLYQAVEGYSWPARIRRWRVERAHAPQRAWLEALQRYEQATYHAERKRDLVSEAHADELPAAREAAAQALTRVQERLDGLTEASVVRRRRGRTEGRFRRPEQPLFTFGRPRGEPEDGSWLNPYPEAEKLLPTRAGNAFRAMETWGSANLGLDSQIMWNELLSVAPAPVREAAGDVELGADMMLAAYVSAAAFTTASAWSCVAIWAEDGHRLDISTAICVVAGLLTLRLTYRGLTAAARAWGEVVRTMVIMGREPLRKHLKLRIPSSTDEEISLWTAITGFAHYGASYGHLLDPWRDLSSGSQEEDRGKEGQP